MIEFCNASDQGHADRGWRKARLTLLDLKVVEDAELLLFELP